MKIILCAIKADLADAWKLFFKDAADVLIVEADITQLRCDAIVSPANSFGFMDGGLDYALSERFGWHLEKELQTRIKALPEGELLIGQSLLLETGDAAVPFIVSAPTMRIPTNFNIDTSVNAYLAMKAALIAAVKEPRINTIAVPGLCTGVGGMPAVISARQMYQAYKEVILGQRMDFDNFGDAQKYHRNINPQGMIWTN